MTTRTPQPLPRPQAVLPPAALDGRLVAAARRIGDQLAATAIGAGGQTTWVGMTLLGDRYWALAPLDTDLYTGLPGVALFFGALAAVTREQRYAELAHRTLATLTARLDTGPGRLTNLGGFSGWGGVIYVLSQLGQLLQAPQLHAQAAEYAQRIPQLVEKDDQLDLINGSAGCILALLSAHRATAAASLLATATQCGKRLLATARDMEQGLAWQTPMSAARPLCGLSHGASGMALALAALGTATGDPAFQKAARGALDYEAREFCGERRNWPDWRFEEAPGSAPVALQADYMVTWCHGAPGIGLARLGMLADFDGPQVRADLQAAVATTLAEGFGKSHSLCHGDTGNLELLAQASRVLKDATLAQRVRDGAAAVLETIERTGWRCGVPTGVEAPGLMMGLSGIGYGLLRLARPQLVPSVLTLSSAAEQAP